MKRGIATFVLLRSVSLIIVLGIVVSIISFALYYFNSQRCAVIKMEIRQDVEGEIAVRHITFPTADEREAYIQERIQSILVARGMDYCI